MPIRLLDRIRAATAAACRHGGWLAMERHAARLRSRRIAGPSRSPSSPKISLSAGTKAYRTVATRIEIKIKAAHILLNAIEPD